MACPFDLYIRYVITKGFTDPDSIAKEIERVGLGDTLEENIDKQYDLVSKTLPPSIWAQVENRRYEGDFLKWMKVLEVRDAWLGDGKFAEPEMRRRWTLLMGLLDDPHVTLAINGLLIKNVPVPDIAEIVSARFSAMLKDYHITLYRQFLFDPRRMTRKDWKAFLKAKSAKEKSIYFTALTESVDTLKTRLELPADVSVSHQLQYLLSESFQKAKTFLELSTPEAGREARAWIKQVAELTDKYEKYRTGDKADFAKQLQMQFDFVDHDFPTPDSLSMEDLKGELGIEEK